MLGNLILAISFFWTQLKWSQGYLLVFSPKSPSQCGCAHDTRLVYLHLILAYYGIPITVHPTATLPTKYLTHYPPRPKIRKAKQIIPRLGGGVAFPSLSPA